MSGPLTGCAVLVTRPREHAPALLSRLGELGATAVALPTLEIESLPLEPPLVEALREAVAADWLVFVSRIAVREGLARFAELGLTISPRSALAVVGPGSAAALTEAGLAVRLQPLAGFDSEALLEAKEFSTEYVAGKSVVICRGAGGRELLAETLRERGATVRFAELYRRRVPQIDAAPALKRWLGQPRRLVVVTSVQGLTNLISMAGPHASALWPAALITVSERIAAEARRRGFEGRMVVAARPDDEGLIEAALSAHEA